MLLLALVVLAAGVGAAGVLWRRQHSGQASSIPTTGPGDAGPWPRPAAVRSASPGQPPFVTAVGADGRHFLDQYGRPLLVHGDAPWSLLTDLSPAQAELYLRNRHDHGINAALVSLVGAEANGGPADDGSTFDGLRPFVEGEVTSWSEPYWDRVSRYLTLAAEQGITVFLYPIDGWTIGRSFRPGSVEQCQAYGTMVAKRLAALPNLVWMSGGDYFPDADDPSHGTDVDHCIDAMMRGIRTAGDSRPFSIQLGYPKSVSTDNPYWADRVDWNFVYTYLPTYRAVLDAYARPPARPALLGEANYERENNDPDTADTTDETLRRQLLWALTSGAAGTFSGSDDWEFLDGWEERLDTPAVAQLGRLRRLFAGLAWEQLVPDTAQPLVTAGRGVQLTDDTRMDVLDNDYVTAARTPDGRLAVVYVPTARTVSVNRSLLADGTTAVWIDPASGQRRAVPLAGTFRTPGRNAGGTEDWLLLLSASS